MFTIHRSCIYVYRCRDYIYTNVVSGSKNLEHFGIWRQFEVGSCRFLGIRNVCIYPGICVIGWLSPKFLRLHVFWYRVTLVVSIIRVYRFHYRFEMSIVSLQVLRVYIYKYRVYRFPDDVSESLNFVVFIFIGMESYLWIRKIKIHHHRRRCHRRCLCLHSHYYVLIDLYRSASDERIS